jgi:hypothetical protein
MNGEKNLVYNRRENLYLNDRMVLVSNGIVNMDADLHLRYRDDIPRTHSQGALNIWVKRNLLKDMRKPEHLEHLSKYFWINFL